MSPKKCFDEDSELALRARDGDMAAFEELVVKYQSNIFNFAFHFFRNPDYAEDVAQEAFLRAFRFLHTYDPSRRFVTWLYSIARNLCIDKHRERVRKEHVSIDEVPSHLLSNDKPQYDPMKVLESSENAQLLHGAIERLPEKYRTPVILCYMEGLAYQEISDVLGITLNNTKIRIFRAKKLLMEMLKGSEES